MTDIPDSISFSTLRDLHSDKSKGLDFSEPRLSEDIGDLAFLIMRFIGAKVDGVFTHQQIFLADILVTSLRNSYSEKLGKAVTARTDPKEIASLMKVRTMLSIVEDILDELVRDCMKSIGSDSTMPSYRLVKSLDPSVRPHEIEDWLKGL